MTRSVQDAVDRLAEGVPYRRLADEFLEFRRRGDDPVLLLVEAAASTAGGSAATTLEPTVERFRDAFLATGRVRSLADVAALEAEDAALTRAIGAGRSRRVLLEGARVLTDRPETDDLEALRSWAATADVYRYDEDPFGGIDGVGPTTFQHLRMLAGVDAVKPGPATTRLVESVAEATDAPALDARTPLRTVAACEWLAIVTAYRRIDLDRIAWWTDADPDEREAALRSSSSE